MKVVLCTVPTLELGHSIARRVVEERLAACAQLDSASIQSVYHWQGRIESDQEYRLLIKTTAARLPALRARIAELHSYTVPQVVDLDADANEAYASWLEASCGD